ncbi:PREDICTED: trem-like transcript 4 protein isoform X3 [Condylura cristata]|uniref:trem-like transcript 4 protein isoform X3 n=1 Tax=Condylura cristata TaxID=143302 RepID=UPI0006428ADF|nr:PREDICTED: trem-like transcript 4 protein isoform X3 [Condylura cristata]
MWRGCFWEFEALADTLGQDVSGLLGDMRVVRSNQASATPPSLHLCSASPLLGCGRQADSLGSGKMKQHRENHLCPHCVPPNKEASMAWMASLLLLILLLLALGSWARNYPHEVVWAVQEQAVSVKCPSPLQNGKYLNKTWCWQTESGSCVTLVTSSGPQIMAQSSSYLLWDNPAGGFFIITMLEVRKNDIGHYWCGTLSGESVSVIKNITLMMYPVCLPTISWCFCCLDFSL